MSFKSMNQVLLKSYWQNTTRWRNVGLFVIVLIAILKSVQEAFGQDIHGDIYIFWSAGVNFLEGNALYSRIGGAEEFLYPPFAPMVFQLLALMPFPVAVGVFTFFNFVAWFASIGLAYVLVRHYYPNAQLAPAFWIGFLATIRYFWHNISWVNINELVALLSLGGVYLCIKGKQSTGILLLTMATWMKVMPALLILLFFIRKPIPTLLRTVAFSSLIFGAVLLLRGVTRGYQDYVDFWQITLLPFLKEGKVYADTISFGLSSMFAKLLTVNNSNNHHYNIANWPLQLVRKISLIAQVLVLGLSCWRIGAGRSRPVTLSALVLVFLTMLLVAGVTWEGHYVTMIFVLPALYQLLTQSGELRLRRWVVYSAVFVGLLILDTIGSTLYDYAQGFSLITYLTLFLYATALREDWRLVSLRRQGAQPNLQSA